MNDMQTPSRESDDELREAIRALVWKHAMKNPASGDPWIRWMHAEKRNTIRETFIAMREGGCSDEDLLDSLTNLGRHIIAELDAEARNRLQLVADQDGA